MKLYQYQGRKLKTRRKELGLTGTDVGSALGISQAGYSAWENGVREVPAKRRQSLADVLETTWEWISVGEEPEEKEERGLAIPNLTDNYLFQCGVMLAEIRGLARQWRASPTMLDGLDPRYRDRLETIFEAGL